MVVMTPRETKGTAFQELCIHGSWTEILQFLTEWRKEEAAKREDVPSSYTVAYEPYGGFVDAFRYGRFEIVQGLIEAGLTLKTDSYWYSHRQ